MNNHVPTINLISAVAEDGAIGKDDALLWRIPADFAFYKAKTLDNVIIMGEKTYETLPKVALRGRRTVVVSEKYSEKLPFSPEDEENRLVFFTYNPAHALATAKTIADEKKCDIYVAGGASMYEQLMGDCEFAFITWVRKSYPDANKHFPVKEFLSIFDLISEGDWSRRKPNLPKHKFSTYKNNRL